MNYKCLDFEVYDKNDENDEEQVCARSHFQIRIPYLFTSVSSCQGKRFTNLAQTLGHRLFENQSLFI